MAKNVDTRIAERNRLAELNREHQNPFAHAVSGAGLAVANGWDHVTKPFKSNRSIFLGATAFGVARGAALGAAIGILGIAIAPATLGVGFFLAAAGAGAVVSGIKDGQTKLEKHWHVRNDEQLSNRIAIATGAVPPLNNYMAQASPEVKRDMRHPDKPSRIMQDANATLQQADALLAQDDPSFAQRENARRASRNGPLVRH